jgi:hypothetical protein
VTNPDGLDAGERRLGTGLVRTHEPLEPDTARPFCDREHTADATKATVERQLTARSVLLETRARDLPRSGEQRKRDRQIEPRALLLELCGRKVHCRPIAVPFQLCGFDPASHPLLRFLASTIG